MTIGYTAGERAHWLNAQHKTPASATVMITDHLGRLLVVKATYKSYWTTPGGVIDAGESPKKAALREIQEEVGLALEADQLKFLSVVFRSGDVVDTYQFIFSASISGDVAATVTLQEEEIADYAFVSKEELLAGGRVYAPIVERWANGVVWSYSEETIESL